MGFQEIAGMELVGDGEQHVGSDMDALFGARLNPQNAAVQRAMAQRAMQNAQLVRSQPYTKSRKLPLGIDSGAVLIAAGASQAVPVVPQALYSILRLIVSSAIAASFTIDDIKVGNVSQFIAAGSLPGDMFGPTATEVELKGDTCQPGLTITVLVTNISGAGARFRGGFIGLAMLP